MYPLRTWNQPIWTVISLLLGSFVSPVINQLSILDDYAAKVGCSFGIFEVPVQVYYEPVAPLCSGLAAVQVGFLDFAALRTFVGRTTASSFAYANG
jgi:hypothetical protein